MSKPIKTAEEILAYIEKRMFKQIKAFEANPTASTLVLTPLIDSLKQYEDTRAFIIGQGVRI